MDVYKARTYARFAGIFFLLLCVGALLMMQRTLVAMKAGEAPAERPRRAAPRRLDLTTERAARNLFAGEARLTASADLDGDGRLEALAVRLDPSAPPGQTWVRRAAVLSPSADGGHEVLVDSSRASDLPRPRPKRSTWLARDLRLERLELEAVNQDGDPAGLHLEIQWDPAERRFRVREVGPLALAPATHPLENADRDPASGQRSTSPESPESPTVP